MTVNAEKINVIIKQGSNLFASLDFYVQMFEQLYKNKTNGKEIIETP